LNPTSAESTRLVERGRARVLSFFRADPAEYAVVFTANASHALKLVGESYPFSPGDSFLLTYDNHNSVNGIREFDRLRGARTIYVPMVPAELRVDESVLRRHLDTADPRGHNLFAYPAQSNFSGVQHPLEWIGEAHARGWDVLLDAAAFVATNRLDLSRVRPDFVALSFYKMFGYPTGVGALIARRVALGKLHRPWFAGGTIDVASVQADRFVLSAGAAGFEDGTPDFANIPAVELGLDFLDGVGIEVVHERVRLLTGWLIERLLALEHPDGRPLVRLYGPTTTDRRGGTLAFNFYDADGHLVDHRVVERRAAQRRISLRTGCFCNPGAGELALGLSRDELERCFAAGSTRMTREDLRLCVDPKAAGAVRISLGLVSNFADAHALVEFARDFLGK
jgi:selenocysteine lyase/cysteine desulfurase